MAPAWPSSFCWLTWSTSCVSDVMSVLLGTGFRFFANVGIEGVQLEKLRVPDRADQALGERKIPSRAP